MNRKKTFFSLIFLALIVLISFGQATSFTLWQDDNALIFKLQHPNEQVGVFGPGPLGLGAYRYIALPYLSLYRLFGLNTALFYSWAIFFYFLASISLYLLARKLTNNKLLALLSGSIFAAGYIGSDGILRLFNSIQTSYSIIFASFLFFFLYRYSQKKKVRNYLIAVAIFILATETGYVRTQYLIFPLVIFIFLFLKSIWLNLPFVLIYYWQFLKDPDPRSGLVYEFAKKILAGRLDYTNGFFGSLGNFFVPQPITSFLFSLTKRITLESTNQILLLKVLFLTLFIFLVNRILSDQKKRLRVIFMVSGLAWFGLQWAFLEGFLGGLFILLLGAGVWVVLKQNKKIGLILVFLLSWIVFNILSYAVYLPFSSLETINRYLTHSLAGYALFFPLAFFYVGRLFWKSKQLKRNTIIVIGLVVATNIGFSIDYQSRFIKEKSIPTKKFYQDLQKFLPEIEEGSLLYFDVAQNPVAQQQFKDFFSVASMPDTTAIAVRYRIDRYDFDMVENFDELLSLLDKKNITKDQIFSFYYDADGLVNTTIALRQRLEESSQVLLDSKEREFIHPSASLLTPAILEVVAKTQLADFSSIDLASTSCSCAYDEKKLLFHYLLSRGSYYRTAKVKTLSSEKGYQPSSLIDNDLKTIWRGNRGWWLENKQEIIEIDLGEAKNVGQFIWVNGYANSTPVVYGIEFSRDGQKWQELKRTKSPVVKENGAEVVEEFKPVVAQYWRMVIEDTFDHDAPAVSDTEVLDPAFDRVDRPQAVKLGQNPFRCITNYRVFQLAKDFVVRRGMGVEFVWKTNKDREDNSKTLLFKPDGLYHTYQALLPAGGTKLEYLKISSIDSPARISISQARLIIPSKSELFRLMQE